MRENKEYFIHPEKFIVFDSYLAWLAACKLHGWPKKQHLLYDKGFIYKNSLK